MRSFFCLECKERTRPQDTPDGIHCSLCYNFLFDDNEFEEEPIETPPHQPIFEEKFKKVPISDDTSDDDYYFWD